MAIRPRLTKPKLGWREWIALPDFEDVWIKAKVDTGARTSAIHAFDVRSFERDGAEWIRFTLHPLPKRKHPSVVCEAPLLERRKVTSSNGKSELRPVIRVPVRISGRTYEVDLTLTRRDAMGFRMLLGREALKRRFLVDPGKSYLGGTPPTEEQVQ